MILAVASCWAVASLSSAMLFAVETTSNDAEDALQDAQAATGRASSFHLDLEGDERTGGASGSPVLSTGDAAWSKARWKVTVDVGVVVVETVYDGHDVYERSATSTDALAQQKWTLSAGSGLSSGQGLDRLRQLGDDLRAEADDLGASVAEDDTNGAAVTLAESIFLGGGGVEAIADDAPLVYDPHAFLASLARLRGPELSNGRLTATLAAPADIVGAFGHPIPVGTIALDLDDEALPTAVHYSTEQGNASAELHFELSGWNEPVEVALPPEEELDRTPWVDEQGLLGLKELAVVWPTAPPEGWTFSVWSPAELTDEGVPGSCEMVELDWDEPVAPDGNGDPGYLSFLERPAACAHRDDPTAFSAGGPAGLQYRINQDETLEVLVGATAVQIDSTLSDAALESVLATMTTAPVPALITAALPPPTTQAPITA